MEDRHHEKPPDRLQSQVPYSTSFSIIWNFSDHVFSDHLINIILIFKWWFRFKPSGKRIIIIVSPQKCNTLNRKHFPMILKSIRFRSNYTVHIKYILNQESNDKPIIEMENLVFFESQPFINASLIHPAEIFQQIFILVIQHSVPCMRHFVYYKKWYQGVK